MSRATTMLGLVAVVLITSVVFQKDAITPSAGTVDLRALYTSGHTVGPPGAAVSIVEIGSFTCSACISFARSLDSILSTFPDQVSLTWVSFAPTVGGDGVGRLLANAAACAADQGKFAEFYDAFISPDPGPWHEATLIQLGTQASIPDLDEFRNCIQRESHATLLAVQSKQLLDSGVDRTPTWFLNGKLFTGAASATQLDSLVRSELRPRS